MARRETRSHRHVLPWLLGGLLGAHLGAAACAGVPPCEKNSDCVEGYCFEGVCREECSDSELDCPKGYFCNELSQCEYGGSSSSGSGGNGGSTGGTGGSTSSGSSGTGAGGGTSSSSSGTAGELDRCQSEGDCAAGLSCLEMTVGGVKRCLASCTSSASCPAGTRCLDRGGKRCFGDDAGRSCVDASLCNFGCLEGPGYCTVPCVSGADCPNGYGCMGVGQPPVAICVRAEAYCGQGDSAACLGSAFCDLGPNLIVGGCTTACDSASDCPQRAAPLAKWSCDGVLCRRPADVYGPLPGGYTPVEYHCNASLQPVALCNDAQHIDFDKFLVPAPPYVNCNSSVTTAGVAGDACVDSCRFQGGCSFGYACVVVAEIAGQGVGLCLPTGGGEPGTPCSKNRDCAFGLCRDGACSRDCTADGICPGGLSCVPKSGPPVEGQTLRQCQ
jgi:hypothetical protein